MKAVSIVFAITLILKIEVTLNAVVRFSHQPVIPSGAVSLKQAVSYWNVTSTWGAQRTKRTQSCPLM